MSDFTVEVEREDDGRWIGEVVDLPGVLTYGSSRETIRQNAESKRFGPRDSFITPHDL